MEERLNRILCFAFDQLQFAETKLAALIVVNAASLFGLLNFLSMKNINFKVDLNHFEQYSIALLALFLLISSALCFYRIIPRLGYVKPPKLGTKSDRVIFFKDICSYESENEYLDQVYMSILTTAAEPLPIEKDYCREILIIARISMLKFSTFRLSIFLTILAYALLFMFIISHLFF